MALWPPPADEVPPPDLDEISREVHAFGRGQLPGWEAGYLEYHRRRYQDTLRLLPRGDGRRLLDVGSFPGHLSALAQARGWEVAGLNNAIEGGGAWTDFLERCQARKIAIHGCEVEREPFPLPTASIDAVLFCELFEHLHVNPFHTLKEIFRVLRPGGLLVLTTPNLRRIETLSRLWHGWGPQPPLGRAFHELEREAVATACAAGDVVVSTGGGTLLDERNSTALADGGLLVCLTATPRAIARRVRGSVAERPLLHGHPSLTGRIRDLLE